MPPLHKYFGTPITTFILSKFLEIPISDAHCGLRAMSAKVYNKLPFIEGGWEYSTEMLIEAHRISENFVEIPTNFRKSLPMRRSHLKISKIPYWLPIRAGLGSIRVSVTRGKKSIMHYFMFPYLFFSYLFLTRTGPANLEVFRLLSWFSVGILLTHAILNSYINSVFNTYEISKFISLRRIFRFNTSLITLLLLNFLLFIFIILSVFFKDLIAPIFIILGFCITAIFYFLNVINYEIKLNYLKRVSAYEK
jgi:hypothetical protein